MHTFNFLFIKTYLKFLKTLLHISVIRPSSGSLSFLAKITLINISFDIPLLKLAKWQHVCNTKYIYYLSCQIYIDFLSKSIVRIEFCVQIIRLFGTKMFFAQHT